MNILQIIDRESIISGGSFQLIRLSTGLAKLGHKVTAVFHYNPDIPDSVFDSYITENLTILRLPLPKLNINFFKNIPNILNLRKFIKKNQFDIIHAHKGTAVSYSLFATKGLNIPIIANCGMSTPLNYFRGYKYRNVYKCIAVSEYVKKIITTTGSVPEDKVKVIYGSVELDKFNINISKDICRKEWKIKDNEILIGTVGNATYRKGYDYLIDAYNILNQKYDNLKFVIIGDGDFDNLIGEKVKKYNLSNKIIFTGFRKDIPQCLAAMDIFITTPIMDEGLTGTLREAMAMKKPVISTDEAGNVEIVKNMETGLIIPKRNVEAIVEAIEKYILDKNLANTLALNGYKLVSSIMNNDFRVNQVLELYNEAIRNTKKR